MSGRGQAYAGAVDAAGGLEDLGHRGHRVRPSALAFGLPERAQPLGEDRALLPVEPFAQRVGKRLPDLAVGPGPGPVAQQPDLQGRVVAAGGVVAVGARMRRDAGPGGIERGRPRTGACPRR